jgi:hypothetical protein
MFPMNMPEMPQEVIDMIGANPEGFAEAMGSGMEAMTAAMEGGASPAEAFEAMGDTMGPLMEDLGMSPDVFDAMGDMVGAAVGPAMHMAPADANGDDMGAMMQDGMDMMMPPGTEVPGPIMDAMGDMGAAMGDAGMGCHDVASEFMAPPGDAMYPMPMDGEGNPVVEPGDPSSCPADACQPPPMDGACATAAPDMMPPEGGYDHAPMNDDFVMPEPFDMTTATNVSQGLNPDGSAGGDGAEPFIPPVEMATPDPAGDPAPGAEPFIPPVETAGDPAPGAEPFIPPVETAGDPAPVDLGAALGGAPGSAAAGGDPAPDAFDAALGSAMDGATDQGGAPGSAAAGGDPAPDAGGDAAGGDAAGADDVDPSAGMG